MRDKIRITAKSCYINGEAIPFEKDFVLAKRDVVEVSFSENIETIPTHRGSRQFLCVCESRVNRNLLNHSK